MLHLHHLTPLNGAAARVAPDVPVVGHLHGTELLMLEAIAEHGDDVWPFATEWAARLREWANACPRLIVLSGTQIGRAERLLGIDPARCVQIPNGFDPAVFERRPLDRVEHWRRHLVAAPQGWAPGRRGGLGRLHGRRPGRRSRTTRRCCCSSGASPRSSASAC